MENRSLSQSWEKQLRRRKALGECKQYTVPRTLCTRNIFSRVAQDLFVQRALCNVKQVLCPFQEWSVSRAHHVSFALVIAGFSTFSHPQPSRGDEHPPDLRTGGFGHLAIQSMSPTPSWRSAVRRLLLFTDHQEGYVSAQYTIPMLTSHLRPCLRKWMRDNASEGCLYRCVCSREKQVQQLQEFITPLEKVLRQAHIRSAGRLVATHSHKRKSSRDPRREQETYSASDRMRTERKEVRDHLRFREDEAAKGVNAAKIRLSETEFHTRLCSGISYGVAS